MRPIVRSGDGPAVFVGRTVSVETTTSFKINQTFVTPTASVAVALTGTDCGVV
jgi:hypothetical protein